MEVKWHVNENSWLSCICNSSHLLNGPFEAIFDCSSSGYFAEIRGSAHKERLLQIKICVLILESTKMSMRNHTNCSLSSIRSSNLIKVTSFNANKMAINFYGSSSRATAVKAISIRVDVYCTTAGLLIQLLHLILIHINVSVVLQNHNWFKLSSLNGKWL